MVTACQDYHTDNLTIVLSHARHTVFIN